MVLLTCSTPSLAGVLALSSNAAEAGSATEDTPSSDCSSPPLSSSGAFRCTGTAGCIIAFATAALAAAAASAPAAVAVLAMLAVGFVFLVLGSLGFRAQDGLPVGDDMVVVGMDFAESQETTTVSAIFDEGGLQGWFDPGYTGEVDVSFELLLVL